MSTHWTERLSEYHDGELSPAEHAACEAHLARVRDCRDVLAELAAGDRRRAGRSQTRCRRPISGRAFWRGSIQARLKPSPDDRSWGRASAGQTTDHVLAAAAGAGRVAADRRFGRRRVCGGASARRPQPIARRRRKLPIQAMAEPMIAAVGRRRRRPISLTPQFDRAVADLERMLRRAARRTRPAHGRGHRAQPRGDRRSHSPGAGGARRRPGQHVSQFASGRRAPAQARAAAPRDVDRRRLADGLSGTTRALHRRLSMTESVCEETCSA